MDKEYNLSNILTSLIIFLSIVALGGVLAYMFIKFKKMKDVSINEKSQGILQSLNSVVKYYGDSNNHSNSSNIITSSNNSNYSNNSNNSIKIIDNNYIINSNIDASLIDRIKYLNNYAPHDLDYFEEHNAELNKINNAKYEIGLSNFNSNISGLEAQINTSSLNINGTMFHPENNNFSVLSLSNNTLVNLHEINAYYYMQFGPDVGFQNWDNDLLLYGDLNTRGISIKNLSNDIIVRNDANFNNLKMKNFIFNGDTISVNSNNDVSIHNENKKIHNFSADGSVYHSGDLNIDNCLTFQGGYELCKNGIHNTSSNTSSILIGNGEAVVGGKTKASTVNLGDYKIMSESNNFYFSNNGSKYQILLFD